MSALSSLLWHNSYARQAIEQGYVPRRLQGARRVLVKRETAQLHALIIGVEPHLWPLVEAAYPEWNKVFLRRSASLQEVEAEFKRQPNLCLFLGTQPPRSLLLKLLNRSYPIFTLSPAPFPSQQGQGFILEPRSPWFLARRESEVNAVLNSTLFKNLPLLLEPALAILPPAPRSKEKLELENATRYPLETWNTKPSQEAFSAKLKDYGKLQSFGHPLTVLALLAGLKTQIKGRFFVSPHAPRLELLASLLLLSRYVTLQGEMVDYV